MSAKHTPTTVESGPSQKAAQEAPLIPMPPPAGKSKNKFAWHFEKGLRIHASGARVERVVNSSEPYWCATLPDGEPIRVTKNLDGSDYTPRPWHTGQDKPIVWRFTTAKRAMQEVEHALSIRERKAEGRS